MILRKTKNLIQHGALVSRTRMKILKYRDHEKSLMIGGSRFQDPLATILLDNIQWMRKKILKLFFIIVVPFNLSDFKVI